MKWRKDKKENRFTEKYLLKKVLKSTVYQKKSQFVYDKKEEKLSKFIVYSEHHL